MLVKGGIAEVKKIQFESVSKNANFDLSKTHFARPRKIVLRSESLPKSEKVILSL